MARERVSEFCFWSVAELWPSARARQPAWHCYTPLAALRVSECADECHALRVGDKYTVTQRETQCLRTRK